MTTFHIITLFPNAFDSYLGESILKRAIEDKKIRVKFYNPRDFVKNKWHRVDQRPYGGGPGMVIEALPVIKAIEKAVTNSKRRRVPKETATFTAGDSAESCSADSAESCSADSAESCLATKTPVKIIFFSPSGKQLTNDYADKISKGYPDIILVCGRYEGIDARVKKSFRMEEISVGPFVLTGGELPAMIVIDSIARRLPGVLGDINSLEESRVASSNVYTRPEVFEYKGKKYQVPKILLSGHRAKIEEWKKAKNK